MEFLEYINRNNISFDIEELDISNNNFIDLRGINKFKNLKILYCNNCNLTYLNTFSLKKKEYLLPKLLKELDCSDNQITSLNLKFLNSLEKLECYNNKIIQLYNLPDSLKYLDCCINQITQLENLPIGLEYLSCYYNKIKNHNYPKSLVVSF